jgi:exodeoxyribonuclease VII large subunit
MEQISLDWSAPRTVYTVSELNTSIRESLGKAFANLWVAGEISGLKPASSGHLYFTLKDAASQLRCVCFKGTARWLRFKPVDGIAVLARGRIDVYEPRGEYQLLIDHLEPQGYGALQLAFEQLKKKLDAEGLFAATRKRKLPGFPRRIGLVTSPTGAVIRDVVQILERRFPGLHLRLYPAQVQGAGSAEQVVAGIEYFSRSAWADVVIVCRGGGSIEDLWTFNEESVARAIAACAVPVISGVGHETDFTIADFAADLRAPTPSAAAEMVIRSKVEFVDQVEALCSRIERGMRLRLVASAGSVHQLGFQRASAALGRRLGKSAQRVDELEFRRRERIRTIISANRRRVESLSARLNRSDPRVRLGDVRRRWQAADASILQSIRLRLAAGKHRLEPLCSGLAQLNPLAILDRGYAIASDAHGRILRDAAATSPGEELTVQLAQGRVATKVVTVQH